MIHSRISLIRVLQGGRFSLSERRSIGFLNRVQMGAPESCWLWTGAVNAYGYGFCKINHHPIMATRVLYFSLNPDCSLEFCVCHTCDNRLCVNPAHLWHGTRGDNNRDCSAKGRCRDQYGERNNLAKLREQDVHDIRGMYRRGATQMEIAVAYGVSDGLVCMIISGKRWGHVKTAGAAASK